MAANKDFVYDTARLALNTAQINLSGVTIGAALVSASYSPQPSTDQFLSQVPAGAIVAQQDLSTPALSPAGALQGFLQFNALISPSPIVALLLYIDTGDPSTSQLLYYSSGGPGFPFVAQGFNYVIGFDQNNGGYFQ